LEPHKNLRTLDDYPGVRDLNNFIVLVVCDGHSSTQALNLIDTARRSFGANTPLRLFWFARAEYFDAASPGRTFFAPTWRSCKPSDHISRSFAVNETTKTCPWLVMQDQVRD
jgi:hypothetical protein